MDDFLAQLQRLAQTLAALQRDLDVSRALDGLRSETGQLLRDAVPSLIISTVDVHGSGGPFTGDPTIRLFEPKVQALADAALVIVAMFAFYRIMWGHGVFSQYTVRIMLPRLAAAAALINLSPQLFQAGVDLDNALARSVVDIFGRLSFTDEVVHSLNDFFPFPFISTLVSLVVALGFLVLALAYVVRYALLVLLAILAPGAALLMVLPDTAHYAKEWVSLFISTLLMQPLQLLILAIGLELEFTGTNWWSHGFALATLWLCFKVPGALHAVSSIGTHAESMARSHLKKAAAVVLK
ncbi:MAG TPA: conjugal transfer protein TrbL family protein [Candidatus Dormibacteraeota bacterium]